MFIFYEEIECHVPLIGRGVGSAFLISVSVSNQVGRVSRTGNEIPVFGEGEWWRGSC